MEVEIPASHGALEGVLWSAPGRPAGSASGTGPDGAPVAAALVCHPHPLFGGTLHNPVTYRVADAFRRAGCAVLRFNFRGVGRSTGVYDEGRGELEDARDALAFLARAAPGVPLWSAGYSFGAYVALALAASDPRPVRALAVGTPLSLFPFDFLRRLHAPTAFVHPDGDEYGSVPELEAALRPMPGPHLLRVVSDADHVYTARLPALEHALAEAVSWLGVQPPAAARPLTP